MNSEHIETIGSQSFGPINTKRIKGIKLEDLKILKKLSIANLKKNNSLLVIDWRNI